MIKAKITFVVPESLQHELRQRVALDGYGLRGKSRWVSEAVMSLLDLENFVTLVQYSEELQGFDKVETVVITMDVKHKLDAGILETRRQFPTLEGVQSSILRTAIMQRFLRGL